MIFFDEDCNARFYPVEAGTMTTEHLDPIVDKLENSDTAVICIGVNSKMPMFPDSKVMPSFTEGFDMTKGLDQPWMQGQKDVWAYRNAANIMVLHNHGIDSNQYLLERTRCKGMKGWVSIRMNDIHSTWIPRSPQHSALWMDHPELRIRSHFPESGLSYEHQQVRDIFYAVVEEIMEKYDAEGYMIDWMRHVPHFDDGKGEENIPLINQLMQRIRQCADRIAEKRGHAIQVIARVPPTIQSARFHGLDAVQWAQSHWVDTLIISPKYLRSYDLDANSWKKAIGNQEFPVLANIDNAYQPYPGYPPEGKQGVWRNEPIDRRQVPFVRGACRKALANGADGIYLFNFMAVRNKGIQDEIFHECGSLEKLDKKNFAIDITYDDLDMAEGDFLKGWRCPTNDGYFKLWRTGLKEKNQYPYQLPLDIAPGEQGKLLFRVGPIREDFPQVLLRFEGLPSDCEVQLNGIPCQESQGVFQLPTNAPRFEHEAVAVLTNTTEAPVHVLRASIYFIWEPREFYLGDGNSSFVPTGCAVDV
jgi:hypothetical protein